MELKVERFENRVVRACRVIFESHRELTVLLDGCAPGDEDRPAIDRNLVRMSVASQAILDLVAPHPSTGEVHGLPKQATRFGDEPDVLIVDRDNPKWDFRPWFTEKAVAIRQSLNDLMGRLEREPEDDRRRDAQRTIVGLSMAEIKDKAEAILAMIESGRLTITDVKLRDAEP